MPDDDTTNNSSAGGESGGGSGAASGPSAYSSTDITADSGAGDKSVSGEGTGTSGTPTPSQDFAPPANNFAPDAKEDNVMSSDAVSLVDELGVTDLRDPVTGGRGRIFISAGRQSPVAEFTDEFVVLHPPQKPFQDADSGPAEEIVLQMDRSGVLVDEFGQRRKISGARFFGREIFFFWEQRPGTLKHYAVFFDDLGKHHYLTINGERVTTDVVYKLRNMTHDGELTKFAELDGE